MTRKPSPLGIAIFAALGVALARVLAPTLNGLGDSLLWQLAPWGLLVIFWACLIVLVRRGRQRSS